MVVEDATMCGTATIEDQTRNEIDSRNHSIMVPEEHNGNVNEGDLVVIGDVESKKAADGLHQIYPLEHSWTFWFDNPSAKSKQAAWGSSIRPIYTYKTVQEFWSIYNNVHRPSKLTVGSDFHCFKYKIEPKWEDPVCANGGKWSMSFPRGKSDQFWLYTLLAMIGEQFEHGDQICGAVVNVRARQDKIALWTKNASNEAAQLSIGRQWKELLDYNDTVGFIFHEHAKKHDRGAKIRTLYDPYRNGLP